MLLNKNTNGNYTPRQLKLPLEIEKIIDISDPVYTFCDVIDHIDLSKYFVEAKGYTTINAPRGCAETHMVICHFVTYVSHQAEQVSLDRAI